MAPILGEVIMIDDDSGVEMEDAAPLPSPKKRRPAPEFAAERQGSRKRKRSSSIASSASSGTMRAESVIEDEVVEVSHQNSRRDYYQRINNEALAQETGVRIDLNDQDEDILEAWVYREVKPDLVDMRIPQPRIRNQNITTSKEVATIKWKGCTIQAGSTLELTNRDFLKVKVVLKNVCNNEVTLRGWLLRRCTSMKGLLELKLNELCYIFDVDQDDEREVLEQSVYEVGLDKVQGKRVLIRTNINRPKDIWKNSGELGDTEEDIKRKIRQNERLFVRWTYTRVWENSDARLNGETQPNKAVEWKIERLPEKDCTSGHSISAEVLRWNWRGETTLGGNTRHPNPQERNRGSDQNISIKDVFLCTNCNELFHVPEKLVEHHQDCHEKCDRFNGRTKRVLGTKKVASGRQPGQCYSINDNFSGAGGSARGAKMAGFHVETVMDCSPDVQPTLAANFPHTRIYQNTTDEFVGNYSGTYVDVLHLSPPCQVWSRIHVRPGKNDERNFAALFSVEELVKLQRPRFVTLEQTFGIMDKRFEQNFNVGLVQPFVRLGYSVAWKIVKFQEWGLPQSRQRLVMIAACPGETLPGFPSSTHSDKRNSGMKPFTRPCDVLARIPRNAPNHDIAKAFGRGNYKSWDATQIAKCITCAGGENCSYPNGLRSFTHRELAVLNGFSIDHVFYGTGIRRQIGNAVPPLCWKILLTHVRKHLERVDGVIPVIDLDID